jgi:hypothetical protein
MAYWTAYLGFGGICLVIVPWSEPHEKGDLSYAPLPCSYCFFPSFLLKIALFQPFLILTMGCLLCTIVLVAFVALEFPRHQDLRGADQRSVMFSNLQ